VLCHSLRTDLSSSVLHYCTARKKEQLHRGGGINTLGGVLFSERGHRLKIINLYNFRVS
jgi:hypothetical protein